MGYKVGLSGTGFQKMIHRIAKSINEINIFDIFKPEISQFVHLDAVKSGNYHYYVSKDPITKIIPNLLLIRNENKKDALKFEEGIIKNISFLPKIWTSDGDPDYDSCLREIVDNLQKFKGVRTIWLGRKPKTGNLPGVIERNTFLITKIGPRLLIEKGLTCPQRIRKVDDLAHHTSAIETVIELFDDEKARLVCIMTPEKYIHFRPFSDRFLSASKKDKYVYHFIGTGLHGNPWAETTCKMIKKRDRWFYHLIRNLETRAILTTLQMCFYNLFTKMDQLKGQSPFIYANANFKDDDEAIEMILNYIE